MKSFLFYFFLLTAFFFFSPLFAQEIPDQNSPPDSISMSWKTFLELWNQAKDPDIKRTQNYAYGRAVYIGSAEIEKEDYYIHFEATILMQSFGVHDTLVPFLSSELDLESVWVNGQSSTWTQKNNYYEVLVSGEGEKTIHAKFTIKLSEKSWPRSFYLPLVPIAQSEVVLHVPDQDVEAQFDPGVTLETISTSEGVQMRGFMPATTGVNIKWLKKMVVTKKGPLKMDATVYSFISLEEEGAKAQTEVSYRILQGETNHFVVYLPKEIDILNVESNKDPQGIAQWFSEESNNHKTIHVYSSYKKEDQFSFTIHYEKTATQSTYQFLVPFITPQEVERVESYAAIGSQTNVEVSEEKIEKVERGEVRFMPQKLRELSQNQALYYFKVLSDQSHLAFVVKSHEQIALVNTRIDQMEATSVLTEEGVVATKITYHVKNNQAQFLKLEFPKKVKLLSAFLNGQEIQPSYNDSDSLLLPIIKSAQQSFHVEIAFLSEVGSFWPIGFKNIFLSQTEVPIGEIKWEIYAPDNYPVLRFFGNLEHQKQFNLLRLLQSYTLEHVLPEAYAGGDYDYNQMGLKKRFKLKGKIAEDIIDLEQDLFQNQVQAQIPVAGNVYSFSSYLLKKSTPRITFLYVNGFVQRGISFAYTVLVFFLTLWGLTFVFEKDSLSQKLQLKKNLIRGAFGLGTLIVLSLIFSFGVVHYVIFSLLMAFSLFAFWQNRQVSKRHHLRTKGIWKYLPELFLAGLILITLCVVNFRMYIAVIVLAPCIILFHFLFDKSIPWFLNKRGKKKAIEVTLMLLLTFLGFGIGSSQAEVSSSSTIGDATIHVNWDVIYKLLKRIEERQHQTDNQIDLGYVFGSAMVAGGLSEKSADLKISLPLRILSPTYIEIPILPDSVPITEARLNGKPLSLNVKDGQIYFEAKKDEGGLGTLEIDLIVSSEETGGVKDFILDAPILKGASIQLSYSKEVQSIFIQGAVWQKKTGEAIRAALGNSQKLHIEAATFQRAEESHQSQNKGVKKRYSQTYTLVSLEETIATFYSSVRYEVLNDEVRELVIKLPVDVVVNDIIGDDLESWEKGEEKDGRVSYVAKVLYPVTERYDLSVKYEKEFDADKGLVLPDLQVEGVARDVGFLGVEAKGNSELTVKKISQVRLMDVRELPEIIRSDASSPLVYAFRYMEHPYEISLEIQKHENANLDPAIADRVSYTHVISPRGQIMVHAKMIVRNSQKQFAAIKLPKGATLQSAFLDGKSVKPTQGEGGKILLPLLRQSNRAFSLEIVYEDKDASLNFIGGFGKIRFPEIDLPISIVTSELFVPKKYRLTTPFGNFSQKEAGGYVSWYRQEEGISQGYLNSTGDDFDSESDEKEVPQEESAPSSGDAGAPPPQMFVQSLDKKDEAKQLAGTLPLKIDLPHKGKKIVLNAFYVPVNAELKIGFLYTNHLMAKLFQVVFLVLFVALGFFFTPVKLMVADKKIYALLGLLIFWLIPITWEKALILFVVGYCLHKIFLTSRKFLAIK